MSFAIKKTLGSHSIYTYDTSKHRFIEYFEKLYNTKSLQKLHLRSDTYNKNCIGSDISDLESDLHKKFYNDIKTSDEFKSLYCNLIKDIHHRFFNDEEYLIYQSFPSIRIQFMNNVVVPPHYDSDDIGKHPIGEKNFLLPITKMYGTNRLFIESAPRKKDFTGIDLEYGDLFYFDGNKCTHCNEKNVEEDIRISLDFRIMKSADYFKYINDGSITHTNPRDPEKSRIPTKMIVGGYYQITHKDELIYDMLQWHHEKDLILQSRPNFDNNEAKACFDYMNNPNNFVTEYKKTDELEKMLASYIGCKHCIMTTSGTSAIILSLLALDITRGDDVIVPNYTMIASINAIKMVGANPIIIDVEKDTYTISIDTIEKYITKNTKAIMHVSLNNRQHNIAEIAEYCQKHNIYLVEDTAQSLGCFVGDKHFGTFGKIGCFSLSTPKIISTGQGGFLITDDDELARKIIMIKNFGRKESGIDNFEVFGLNLKFTDIQAVIGIEQVKKLPYRVGRMREMFNLYYKNLSTSRNIQMIKPQDDKWIPWFIDIFVNDRDKLTYFLKQHNIQTRNTYPEINKTTMYYDEITHENSHYISNNGLYLPSHTLLSDNTIVFICKIINLYSYIVKKHY